MGRVRERGAPLALLILGLVALVPVRVTTNGRDTDVIMFGAGYSM